MKNSVKKMIAAGGLLTLLFLSFWMQNPNAHSIIGRSNQGQPDGMWYENTLRTYTRGLRLPNSFRWLFPETKRPRTWKKIVENSAFQLGGLIDSYTDWSDEYDIHYTLDYGTYPVLDGSTVAAPMAVEFACQHLGFSDKTANSFVDFGTTGYAYEILIAEKYPVYPPIFPYRDGSATMVYKKHPDLIIATEPSDEERALAAAKNIELVVKPVCLDAFVFITHKDNPVESLTVEQIQKIYTGEIVNWKEVGGMDMPILAYQREPNSGSQTGMENLVMKGKTMLPALTVRVNGMMGLVDEVADYQNRHSSIGYTYQYYIDKLYKNENIKTLKIEDIAPTAENLRNKRYPFTTAYYGVIRGGDEKKTGGKFLDWMLSEEGQRCIEQAGYIPIN